MTSNAKGTTNARGEKYRQPYSYVVFRYVFGPKETYYNRNI